MASSGLEENQDVSFCLNLYTLRCGHSFCRVCINQVLNTQDESGVYSCPECRVEFKERPSLQRNITLCNAMENFISTNPQQEEITGISCTYCIHSPVPAIISCLLCESSLHDNHLRVHSKAAKLVPTEPSLTPENRKCSIHKELLKYYCTEDAACICVSCTLAEEHQGHQVEELDEAIERRREKLSNVLRNLYTQRQKAEERVQRLEESRGRAHKKANREAERVNDLFTDIRNQLDDLEKRMHCEISRQEEQRSLSISDLIQKLEIKKAELSRKIRSIEELCNRTDPLTVLQEPDTGDFCDPEEGEGEEVTGGHDGGEEVTGYVYDPEQEEADEDTNGDTRGDAGVQQTLHTFHTLSNIIRDVNVAFYGQRPADILLDVNTAANNILISDDLKTATRTEKKQNRPETAERFQYFQVISKRRFTSGRHYWDVEVGESGICWVGVCYPSIVRRGQQSYIGNTNKSWSLFVGLGYRNQCSVSHDRSEIHLPHQIFSAIVRIYLDYEAGQLSFYERCDPIRHLYTFTATFTEPLHAAFCVWNKYVKV